MNIGKTEIKPTENSQRYSYREKEAQIDVEQSSNCLGTLKRKYVNFKVSVN